MKRSAFASWFSCWLLLGGSTFQIKKAFSAVKFFCASSQVDGARTQGTLFFWGGKFVYPSGREVEVARWDESSVLREIQTWQGDVRRKSCWFREVPKLCVDLFAIFWAMNKWNPCWLRSILWHLARWAHAEFPVFLTKSSSFSSCLGLIDPRPCKIERFGVTKPPLDWLVQTTTIVWPDWRNTQSFDNSDKNAGPRTVVLWSTI